VTNSTFDAPETRHPWLNWLAWLTLIAGLAIGGLALAAAGGVWFGLWDFRQGFQLLGIANTWGARVALAAAVLAIALFALARHFGTGNAWKLATLALIGAVAAWLGYAIPESYRPAENIPPIHDISTDTEDPPRFVAVLPLRGEGSNSVEYGGAPNVTREQLAQLTREAYPDLQTVHVDVPPETAFERALAAVERMGWELVAQVPAEGRIEATDTTFWFRFKDDVVIRIRPSAQGSAVDARSTSRVGIGDAGTNARRLREFFAALDEVS
jgi:uncharacterized protein (DUF1499 family)